jgi:SMC interacting uncharacterized protein involved in chromosome segregation
MAKEDPYFRLRVPETLKSRIEKSAAENNRSMTAEIISRLDKSFVYEVATNEVEKILEEHRQRLKRIERHLKLGGEP